MGYTPFFFCATAVTGAFPMRDEDPGARELRELEACDALADLGREWTLRGWMLGTAGNLSVRVDDDPLTYRITASGGHKGRLTRSDFVRVRLGMDVPSGARRPSAEVTVHDALYGSRAPGAIAHVHSPYITLVSRALWSEREVVFRGLEYVKALGYWAPGAVVEVPIVDNYHDLMRLGEAVAAAAGDAPAVFVRAHGVYAWGESIDAAQRHVEALEFMSQIVWEELRVR